MKCFKKIFSSRLLKVFISVILICVAFRKVDLGTTLKELSQVPVWIVILNFVYSLFVFVLNATRWGFILFNKIKPKKIVDLTRSNLTGLFCSLMVPMTGDFVKWLPLEKKYPDLTKAKLLGSVALDRIVDFTSLSFISFIVLVVGKLLKYKYPNYIFWFFCLLVLIFVAFYVIIFVFDIEKVSKLIPLLKKYEVFDFLKNESKLRVLKALIMSFVSKFFWMLQIYFLSKLLESGFTLTSVFIFVPVISIILSIPISIAGLGVRDNLYIYFFSQLEISDVQILSVSILVGATRLLISLFGGLVSLFNKNQAKA